ncbi:MAG: AI-2E family transporter [Candidatus Magasanikbacteria bacterium]|nr:AI-2E family transporter [Candidatus Magasanikbacteria bacterium]
MKFSKFKNLVFFTALAVVTLVFLYVIRPFFYPIFWSAIIAGIFYPIFKKINSKIKYPNISSLITIIIFLVSIIIPITILSSLVLKETLNLYNSLSGNRGPIVSTVSNIFTWVKNNPVTDKLNINEQQVTDRLTELAKTATDFIFTAVKNLTQNSVTFLIMFIVMLYTLFFFLKDGEKFLKKLSHLSPLGEKHEIIMYKKFTSTARAVLKGTLIVGAVQGFLTGVLFYIVGIEGVLIWAIIGTLFSIVPGLGSYVVWLPAALIMFILGNFWQGMIIVLVGALLISTIDNFIRPILVGKDTQMHPLLILFSTLGGLVIFGVSGFIIGPIITALLLSLWEMYEQYFSKELDNDRD